MDKPYLTLFKNKRNYINKIFSKQEKLIKKFMRKYLRKTIFVSSKIYFIYTFLNC